MVVRDDACRSACEDGASKHFTGGDDGRIHRSERDEKILDTELLDHVIVGQAEADPLKRGVYSFREAGLL